MVISQLEQSKARVDSFLQDKIEFHLSSPTYIEQKDKCAKLSVKLKQIESVSHLFHENVIFYKAEQKRYQGNSYRYVVAYARKNVNDIQELLNYLEPTTKSLDAGIENYRQAVEGCNDYAKTIKETEEKLKQEEQEEQESARLQYEEKIKLRKHDPKWIQPVISAQVCKQYQRKQKAIQDIKKEFKYAKITGGGMIDKKLIYDLQTEVKEADEEILEQKMRIANLHLRLLGCKNDLVVKITNCVVANPHLFTFSYQDPDDEPNPCDQTPLKEYVELIEY